MKLFNISFTEPQEFVVVNAIVKKADPRATITINEGADGFETQSEKAAIAITEQLGGTMQVFDYDIKDIMR